MWKELILWHVKGEIRIFLSVGRLCMKCGKKRMYHSYMITC